MAESWLARRKRLARETDAELHALFASAPSDDKALRDQLDALASRELFSNFTWLWGPKLAKRSRVFFRPFILSRFSSLSINAKGKFFNPWRGETADELEQWLKTADAADDIELTKRLYEWRLSDRSWTKSLEVWRAELVQRYSAAATGSARFTALAKIDIGAALDVATAVSLFDIDRTAARGFILGHLPWFYWSGEKRASWRPLLERARTHEPDFYFELYRRLTEEEQWRADVIELCNTVPNAAELDLELERRHLDSHLENAASTFLELFRLRNEDVAPYLLRHVASAFPRQGLLRQKEADGLAELIELANQRQLWDLWAALLRTSASDALYDAELLRLMRSTSLPPADVRLRLSRIAGHGREAHFTGVSFAQVRPLREATALELYERFPELVHGPFRMHVTPTWRHAFLKLARVAIERGDTELVDVFAASVGIRVGSWWVDGREDKALMSLLTSHYEALSEPEFVKRASNALTRMPAFAVWSYDQLLKTNPLARLLFERSTAMYLSDPTALRDLLESAQIHVQILGLRALALNDPRARQLAAKNADLLQATLFRPLHRRTRLWAFAALENAAKADEATARYLLRRMKEALSLPEKHYPTEQLIGLIAKTLHAWPALRSPAEMPRVYGAASA